MRTRLSAVLELPADLVGAQEVRLDEAGQQEFATHLKDKYRDVVFGNPLQRRFANSKLPTGGVAMIASPSLRLRKIHPNCDMSRWLYGTTRFCHAVCQFEGMVLHVCSVYGYTNSARDPAQREKNERLLEAVLALLGDVPILLLGDLNDVYTL